MAKEFEYKGLWWLPESKERTIPGTLRFNPEDGPILELIGSFHDIPELSAKPPPEIVLGITSNGKKITLYGYQGKSDQISWPGLTTTTMKPRVMFVGYHFAKKEEISFDNLSINYLYLEDWYFTNPFSIKHDLPKEYSMKYQYPKPGIALLEDFKVTLESNLNVSYRKRTDIQVKHSVFIKAASKEKRHFSDFLDFFYKIRNFISLGVKRPVYPLVIRGQTDKNIVVMGDGTKVCPQIEIYMKQTSREIQKKTITPFEMLYSFNNIEAQFETFLKNWIQIADNLKPVHDLYFGTLYNPRMYIEDKFINSTQALETYHRRKFPESYAIEPEKSDEIVKKAVEVVPNEFREHFQQKLMYSHEHGLRTRLTDIIKINDVIISSFIRTGRERKSFIQKVVVTRNFLTHYDKSLEQEAAKGEELYWITQKLKIIIEIILLREIGIEQETIKNVISRNPDYQRIFLDNRKSS